MSTLMDNTLMSEQPPLAVTLVQNHDTQPCQAMESPVEDWFKPLAYAFILLFSWFVIQIPTTANASAGGI
jgi:alpha-amylase